MNPLFRYRLREGLKGAAAFLSSLALIIGIMLGIAAWNDGEGQVVFSAVGTYAGIFFLVWGIVTPREDLRLGLQFGLSRRTVFAANLAAMLGIVVVVTAGGVLFTAVAQALCASMDNLNSPEFYQMLFLPDTKTLTLAQNLASGVFNLLNSLLCYAAGLVISLVYYRLSKFGMVIVSVVGGVVLFGGMPFLAWKLAPVLAPAFLWMASSLGNWAIVVMLLTAVLLAASFLLLRRAPVKSIK